MNVMDYNKAFIQAIAKSFPRGTSTLNNLFLERVGLLITKIKALKNFKTKKENDSKIQNNLFLEGLGLSITKIKHLRTSKPKRKILKIQNKIHGPLVHPRTTHSKKIQNFPDCPYSNKT